MSVLVLENYREAKKLSARTLAALSGISQPVFSRLENNTRSADVELIERICVALGITLNEFFSEKEQFTQESKLLLEKIQKLTPDKRKILNDVLDTWVE